MKAINYDLACKRLSDKFLGDKNRQVIIAYVDSDNNTGYARVTVDRIIEVKKQVIDRKARYFGFYEIV